jgi:hypothetical protein
MYLSILQGKIAQRVPEPTATSQPRTTKLGKQVHEEIFDSVSGHITSVSTKDGEYGKQLLITLEDDGQRAVLQMAFSSGVASSFLKALPNVNKDEKATLRPKMDRKDDIERTVLWISQNGKGVAWAHTKDNPNGLPEMKKIKVKGKESWDDSDQLDYFENTIIPAFENTIIPAFMNGQTTSVSDEDEKLPF